MFREYFTMQVYLCTSIFLFTYNTDFTFKYNQLYIFKMQNSFHLGWRVVLALDTPNMVLYTS